MADHVPASVAHVVQRAVVCVRVVITAVVLTVDPMCVLEHVHLPVLIHVWEIVVPHARYHAQEIV